MGGWDKLCDNFSAWYERRSTEFEQLRARPKLDGFELRPISLGLLSARPPVVVSLRVDWDEELAWLRETVPGSGRAGRLGERGRAMSRAELFWLAYLWACFEGAERERIAFQNLLRQVFSRDCERIYAMSMRASPILRRAATRSA